MGESSKFERPKTPETGDEHFTPEEKNELYLERSSYLLEQLGIDTLTGLKNRTAFDAELGRALQYIRDRAGEPHREGEHPIQDVSIIFLDLDNFKNVNDTYGHLQGDVVLKAVAKVLEHSVRKSDIASRFGGDEFWVLLPRVQKGDAEIIANKILANFKNDPLLTEYKLGASIGVSSSEMTLDATELIDLADKAANDAKAQGKDRVIVASGT